MKQPHDTATPNSPLLYSRTHRQILLIAQVGSHHTSPQVSSYPSGPVSAFDLTLFDLIDWIFNTQFSKICRYKYRRVVFQLGRRSSKLDQCTMAVLTPHYSDVRYTSKPCTLTLRDRVRSRFIMWCFHLTILLFPYRVVAEHLKFQVLFLLFL